MKNQPSDILVPRELTTAEAITSFCERLCILIDSSDGDYTETMRQIALKQALEVERQMTGVLLL